METTTLTAPGIVCGGCAKAAENAVSNLPGVANVQVDVREKRVTVSHDERASRPVLETALRKAGLIPH